MSSDPDRVMIELVTITMKIGWAKLDKSPASLREEEKRKDKDHQTCIDCYIISLNSFIVELKWIVS